MDVDNICKRMQQVLTLVSDDVASVRSGQISPAVVGDLKVAVYGGQQRLKINEVGTISVTDAQTIVVDPWDKSIIGEIKKGIEASSVGLNPSIDGEIIRIKLPALTTEDREKYVRLLSGKIESGKVMVRQVRADGMKDIKRNFEEKELSEDEKFNEEKKLQELTDEFVGKIEEIGKNKEKELLQI